MTTKSVMLPTENYENYISHVLADVNITIKQLLFKNIESRTLEGITFMKLLYILNFHL